jgi:hypothetical protein
MIRLLFPHFTNFLSQLLTSIHFHSLALGTGFRCIKGRMFQFNEIVEFPPLHFPLFVQRETLNYSG